MRLKNKQPCANPSICSKCGGDSVQSRSYSDTVDFRNLELDVEGLQQQWCSSCRFGWETSEQCENNQLKIKEAYAATRDRLRVRDGLLTGDQIQKIRKTLNLTQKEAAFLFGGGINAFNKYESGEVLQSYAMDRLIRLVDFFGSAAVDKLRNADETIFSQEKSERTTNVSTPNSNTPTDLIMISSIDVENYKNLAGYAITKNNKKTSQNNILHRFIFKDSISNYANAVLLSAQNHNLPNDEVWEHALHDYSEGIYKKNTNSRKSIAHIN